MKTLFSTKNLYRFFVLASLLFGKTLPALGQACVPSTGVTLTWTTVAPLPYSAEFSGTAVINGLVYVAGGNGGGSLNNLESYNPGTNSWTALASMPAAASGLVAEQVNGILYTMGGTNGAALNTLQSYNP